MSLFFSFLFWSSILSLAVGRGGRGVAGVWDGSLGKEGRKEGRKIGMLEVQASSCCG